MKKILSVMICSALLFALLSPAASAKEGIGVQTMSGDDMIEACTVEVNALTADYNIEGLTTVLKQGLLNMDASIDITSFNVKKDDYKVVSNIIYNEINEAFHLSQYSYSYTTRNGVGYITVIRPAYTYTQEEYFAAMQEIYQSIDKLTEGLSGLDDLTKALLVHDRLAVWAEYDYARLQAGTMPEKSYTIHGILVDGTGVCQGYAEAYDLIMETLGINSVLVSSEELNHSWNIITIGGKNYHVDVTWDDPVWDIYGNVKHDNFLRSSDGITATKHTASDYDHTPNTTTYDNYYWQKSNSEFQLINGYLYYIDATDKTIRKISAGSGAASGPGQSVLSIGGNWGYYSTSQNGYKLVSYSRFVKGNDGYYYSLPGEIKRFDPSNGTSATALTPSLQSGYKILGFKAVGSYFYIDPTTTASNTADTRPSLTFSIRYSTAYTATFVSGGASTSLNGNQNTPVTAPVPQTVVQGGKVFAEWNTKADGTGDSLLPGDAVTYTGNDTSFYAIYESYVFPVNKISGVGMSGGILYGRGLSGLSPSSLSAALNDGGVDTYSVAPSRNNTLGTGSTVEIYRWNTKIGSMVVVVYGDMDGDAKADGTDAMMANLVYSGGVSSSAFTTAQLQAADVNHDGAVTEADITALENAGLFLTEIDQSSAPSSAAAQNYSGYAFIGLTENSAEQSAEASVSAPKGIAGTPAVEKSVKMSFIERAAEFIKELIKRIIPLTFINNQ